MALERVTALGGTQVLTCLESRKPSQLAVAQYPLEYNNTFRVAQHEYLFCTDTALGMTKERPARTRGRSPSCLCV